MSLKRKMRMRTRIRTLVRSARDLLKDHLQELNAWLHAIRV